MAGLPFTQLPAKRISNIERGLVSHEAQGVPSPTFKGQDPMKMLADQEQLEQHQVTQWFNAERQTLLTANLEPKKFEVEYRKLMSQARDAGARIQAKHQANNLQLQNMSQMVQTGLMTPEQFQQTALVMSGVPAEHVQKAFEIPKQQNLMGQLRDINALLVATNNRLKGFEDKGVHGFWRGKLKTGIAQGDRGLYYTDPATKKERRIKDPITIAQYDALIKQKNDLQQLQIQISGQSSIVRMAMMGQATMAGRQMPPQRRGPARITTEADYNALPIGAEFIDSDPNSESYGKKGIKGRGK